MGIVQIKCPRCGGRAEFEEPFAFYGSKGGSADPPDVERTVYRWGEWYVVEKFPHVFPWRPPARWDRNIFRWPISAPDSGLWVKLEGVAKCEVCHHVGGHDLQWPEDAYYAWSVRGRTLWAWTEEHARVLLDFLASVERDPNRYGAYGPVLRKMPKELITAKVRKQAVKRMAGTLSGVRGAGDGRR